jgi:hypothetical protein
MNKKLIITEEQYRNLKLFLLESTFFDMVDKTIKDSDIITITTGGKKLNFIIVKNFNGQIYMDNIDKTSQYYKKRVFLNRLSFEGDKLIIQVAKDDKQKNEEPPKGDTWQKMTLRNIDDISISRNGKIIDGTNYDSNSENVDRRKLDFLDLLTTLEEGESLKLELNDNSEVIILDFINKSSDLVRFGLSENTEGILDNVNIKSIDILTDINTIEIDNNNLITISVITYESKNGEIIKRNDKIKNIKEYTPIDTERKENEEEPSLDIEKMKQYIEKDTEFKKAMLNFKGKVSPSVFASIFNEFSKDSKSSDNKGPKSSGVIKAKEILNRTMDNYERKRLTRFGDKFKKSGKIDYYVLEKVRIPYNTEKGIVNFTLSPGILYDGKDSVRYIGIDDTKESKYESNIKLINNNIEIILKEKTEKPDTYICDIVKLYTETIKDEKGDNKTVIKRTPPAKDIEIKLKNSTGYTSDANLYANKNQ